MGTADMESRMRAAMRQAHRWASCNLHALPAIQASNVTSKWLESQFGKERLQETHPLARLLMVPTSDLRDHHLGGLNRAIGRLRAAQADRLGRCLEVMRNPKQPAEFWGVCAQLRLADYLLCSIADARIRLEPDIPCSRRVSDIHVAASTLAQDIWVEVYTPKELGAAHMLRGSFEAWRWQHKTAGTHQGFEMRLCAPTMVCQTKGVYDKLFACGDRFLASRPSVTHRHTIWEGPSQVRLVAEPDEPPDDETNDWGHAGPAITPLPPRFKELVKATAEEKATKGQFCGPGKRLFAVNCLLTTPNAQLALFDNARRALLWAEWDLPIDIHEALFFFFYPDQDEPVRKLMVPAPEPPEIPSVG